MQTFHFDPNTAKTKSSLKKKKSKNAVYEYIDPIYSKKDPIQASLNLR